MKKPIWVCLMLFVVVFMMSSVVSAEEKADPRLITVTGEAEVLVVPDEAVLMLGVETKNQDLNAAKAENDKITKGIFAAIKKLNIEDKDVQTDRLKIEPRYTNNYETGKRIFQGYFVSRTLAVTLRDVGKAENLVSDVLTAGANYIYNLDFRTSALRKYRDQARSLAIKAAQQKANLLAAQLEQTVGKPHMIREGLEDDQNISWNNRTNAQVQQVVSEGLSSDAERTVALGQIKVTASVTVSFELQ